MFSVSPPMESTQIILLFLIFSSLDFHHSLAASWIQAGYWTVKRESPVSNINSALFTHLICAFANVNSSTYEVYVSSTDQQYFSSFTNTVKRKNPSVSTLFSIWDGIESTVQSILGEKVNSSVLSLMVSQSSYRRSFIKSSMEMARLYGFSGIELLWLYPNTATQMVNLGLLLGEWRIAVNSEPRNANESQLILSVAVAYLPTRNSINYPIEMIQQNVDWAHVIAYDYHLPLRENFTRAHAALYDPTSNISTDFGIREWIGRGFPASKLVMGLPFHGYAWTLVDPQGNNGIGAPARGLALTPDGSVSYNHIRWYVKSYGATTVYNATYVVNYCFFGENWVGFDGVEAIRTKINYAKEKRLLGYCVFQATNDDNWELSSAAAEAEDKSQENKQHIVLIILLPIAFIVVIMGFVICHYLRSRASELKGRNAVSEGGKHESSNSSLVTYSFGEIRSATDNFSVENKLGEGGFGSVFKGILPTGKEIAVKRLSKSSTQGPDEFKNELSVMARLQHVNLLRILGFCTEREEKMLVYEYMPNRSLDFYIFDPVRRHILGWRNCVQIIEGIIQGLLYLQEYSNFTIIHKDLKSSNILLDEEMNPKIADFGMAKFFRKDEHEANTGRIVGTYGYVPPEFVKKGIYSMKYDVYSFGVVLLQIISGKRNTCYYGPHVNWSLLEYAYELWRSGKGSEFLDPLLDDSSSSYKLMRCMQVGLLCVQENPVDRPTMLEVYSMIKSGAEAEIATPKEPAFSVESEKTLENVAVLEGEMYSVNDAEISEIVAR